MSTTRTSALRAVERLRGALETVAAALAAAHPSDLLSAEEELAAALRDGGQISGVPEGEREAMRRELWRARLVLDRCRRVGAVISQVTAARLALYGGHDQYDRSGFSAPSASSRSSVEVRA